MDLPLQELLARQTGQCPPSQDKMLLLGVACVWAELVAVMVSGRDS